MASVLFHIKFSLKTSYSPISNILYGGANFVSIAVPSFKSSRLFRTDRPSSYGMMGHKPTASTVHKIR